MCDSFRPTGKGAAEWFNRKTKLPVGKTRKKTSIMLWLQCRSLTFIHARGANIHSAIRRVVRRLIDIDNRADRGVKAFVIGQLIRLLFKLQHLIFEFTFFIGQGVLVLQERRIRLLQSHTCVLNTDDSVIDAGKSFSNQPFVSGVNRCSDQVQRAAQSCNSAGNCLNHKNPPVVDERCVRTSDSTTCGDPNDGGGHV